MVKEENIIFSDLVFSSDSALNTSLLAKNLKQFTKFDPCVHVAITAQFF
jgi:hypothetical protein